ncbi:MAG TPA: energy transducer TonB [Candidatus Acidoferrales bacterium]|nr:energy transducer TonB [Candidatus Acidoferrales bacterium]
MSDFSAKSSGASHRAGEPESTLQLGRLRFRSSESSIKSLFSNLRDFLVERPAKIRAGTPTAFDMPGFGEGMGGNLKEFFRSGPRGSVNSGLLVNWHEEPSLWQNLRDLISPKKLPPLKTTSQPVAVKEIWSKNTQYSRVQLVSIAVHVVGIAMIVLIPLLFPGIISPPGTKAFDVNSTDVSVSPYIAKLAPAKQMAGGGGGAHDKADATRGKPPKFSWEQFAAPMAHPVEHPQIAMTPTVLGNPDIKLPDVNAPNWGDPFAKNMSDSMGRGHGSGVGNGNGAGVGPGEGWNTGGGYPNAGSGGYGQPACYYMPKAEYTDEAVKVKVQGSVELLAVVTADGRVTDPHVAKGLGFGLDEKAVEAVRTWRCTPARGPDGKPAAVRVLIEATFSLY